MAGPLNIGRFVGSILFTMILSTGYAHAQLEIVANGKSDFKIIIPRQATDTEQHAAEVLQQYINKIASVMLPIQKDDTKGGAFEILIGNTNRSLKTTRSAETEADKILIQSSATKLLLNGAGSKGPLYAVYTFLERYLDCRRYTETFEIVPKNSTITIPNKLNIELRPDFSYREVYYRYASNNTYRDWYKLHNLDDHWGLWVHSFDKLVPAKTYFASHPEYYALVDSKRKPSQLCLSNPQVFKILSKSLEEKMEQNPTMQFWSVSQNDDQGYCECSRCRAVDLQEGGPQGSILKFVNKVAAKFPQKTISTLAYTYSQKAPLHLKPAKNVQIMLCSIDCNRSQPIATDPGAAAFRRDLSNWSRIAPNLIVWDYTVQFTNYVSPFPNFHVLQSNIQFFKKNGVKGVFLQGSGNTNAELSELRAFLLARLSWDTQADVKKLTTQFLVDYYGKAAPYIQQYINLITQSLIDSKENLDIYGGPVSPHATWLSPELLDQYGILFDKAEDAVANDQQVRAHVAAVRLPVDFVVLQQSRFYGIQKHGVFVRNGDQWMPKANFKTKVANFVNTAREAGITLLSEDGLTPENYRKEWDQVFNDGPKIHDAIGARVTPITPFNMDYFNKGAATLTDGSRGYLDFQYNWLGWYGDDLEVVVDLGKETPVKQISTSFLEDQRHWAFLPANVIYSFSTDNITYMQQQSMESPKPLYEDYDKSIQDYTVKLLNPVTARYVKVSAKNLREIPVWRYYKNRKAWLFMDEIMVNKD